MRHIRRMRTSQGNYGKYDDVFNGYVFRAIEFGSVCLDVGCWVGNLGRRLISEKGCIVDGVDSREDVLAAAKKNGYRTTFKFDLNTQKSLLPKKNLYDYIIFSDVLEHLIEPGQVLANFKPYLKNNGEIVISVPNIAFILYRMEHLFGKFEYDPTGGVMDTGHLKFFTKRSIERMCKEAGYKIIESKGYSQVKKRFFFLKILGKFYPELFSIQMLVRLGKSRIQ